MRVCIFGTFDPGRQPRVTTIEDGLRSAGVDTVRCNAPWNAPTDVRVAALRRPHLLVGLAVRLVVAWLRLVVGRRRVGRVDVVVVGYLGILDVHLARFLWPRAVVVLDHMAPAAGIIADRHTSLGPWSRIAGWLDRAATRRSDIVIVDTEEHVERRDRGWVVVPVGAAWSWFQARATPQRSSDRPLRVVFFGLFTPLQGARTIAEALRDVLDDSLGIKVTMIGHGQDLAACLDILGDRRDIAWRHWVEAEQLPALVASHDVCLGIFGDTPKALRVVPNKVFQGAAAGCALVTSDTPPQRRTLGEAALFVPPGDAPALADAVRQLEYDRALLSEMRRRAGEVADSDFRAETIVAPLLGRLGQAVDDR